MYSLFVLADLTTENLINLSYYYLYKLLKYLQIKGFKKD